MIKINLVAVGKVKEKYFTEGILEYKKRLGGFCEFNIVEVSEENFRSPTPQEIVTIKQREAERILPHLKGYVVAMAIEGQGFSSPAFARFIKDLTDKGSGVITFVIGGSYGLSDEVKSKADKLMSFSNMTFPHTLFRLMMVEQLYRAFSINANSSYHK